MGTAMFQFTDDMKTGIQHVDDQHRQLVDLVNQASSLGVSNPDKAEMKTCLDFLGEYVVKHFGDEEKLQQESSYPDFPRHQKIHEDFVQTFKTMYADFEANGPSSNLSFALSNTVTNWLIAHIKVEDVKFGKHYAGVA
jgi:hemerythrin